MSNETPVEAATKHVERVQAQLAKVLEWKPGNAHKGKVIAAIRRELADAEKALAAAKAKKPDIKAVPDAPKPEAPKPDAPKGNSGK